MSNIDITALHHSDRESAQDTADALAADLAAKFDIDYGWDEDTIHFERPGVTGSITIDDKTIQIQARLGLLLALLKGPIEDEIRRYLCDELGCSIDSMNSSSRR